MTGSASLRKWAWKSSTRAKSPARSAFLPRISGDNDLFDRHPNTLAIARHGGILLREVATSSAGLDYSITNPHLVHMWWVSNKNGPLKTLEDIRNFSCKMKMQSIGRNTCAEFMTNIFLDKLGIPKDKIDFILLPDVEGVLSLKRELVDIAPPHPPFYKPIEQTRIANVLITSREIAGLDAWTGM